MTAAGNWIDARRFKPTLHHQVLVRLKGGAGFVADVACYVGPQKDSAGNLIERWILADVSLDSRQITHWADLNDIEELKAG